MATLRTFLAIPLAPTLQREIAALQTALARPLSGIRWTRPETVHLTLHFFGAIPADDLEKIRASMLSVRLREKAFQVEILGLGAFPAPHRPRVVWLGLTPEAPLRSLWRACEAELGQRGFAAESRGFVPHLTIGRFRDRAPDLGSLCAEQGACRIGRLPVDRLVLFESRLRPEGARHTPLFTVPLDGAIH